jgi:hypothetical protein
MMIIYLFAGELWLYSVRQYLRHSAFAAARNRFTAPACATRLCYSNFGKVRIWLSEQTNDISSNTMLMARPPPCCVGDVDLQIEASEIGSNLENGILVLGKSPDRIHD